MDCSYHLIPIGFTASNPHSVLCSEWSSSNTNRGMSSFYSLPNLLNKSLKGSLLPGALPSASKEPQDLAPSRVRLLCTSSHPGHALQLCSHIPQDLSMFFSFCLDYTSLPLSTSNCNFSFRHGLITDPPVRFPCYKYAQRHISHELHSLLFD